MSERPEVSADHHVVVERWYGTVAVELPDGRKLSIAFGHDRMSIAGPAAVSVLYDELDERP